MPITCCFHLHDAASRSSPERRDAASLDSACPDVNTPLPLHYYAISRDSSIVDDGRQAPRLGAGIILASRVVKECFILYRHFPVVYYTSRATEQSFIFAH